MQVFRQDDDSFSDPDEWINCALEHLLDIFARSPDSLSRADRRRLETYLDANPWLQEYVDHLEAFYHAFREIRQVEVPDHVRAFADSLVRLPRKIRLRPPMARKNRSGNGSGFRFLHADSPLATTQVRPAGSLVSTEYGVLVRFIEDREAGELRGYVLSPNQRDAARALIAFESIDTPRPTDDSGVMRMPLTEIHDVDNLLSSGVDIVLPVAEATVIRSGLDPDGGSCLIEEGSIRVIVTPVAGGVRIDLPGPTMEGCLVVDSDGVRSVYLLPDGPLDVKTKDDDSELIVRLYAG